MGQHPTSDTTFNAATVTADGIPAPTGAANLIDSDYVVGQDNILGRISIALDIHGKVFSISALSVLLFLLLTLALQNQVAPLFSALRDTLTSQLAEADIPSWLARAAAHFDGALCQPVEGLALFVEPEAGAAFRYAAWYGFDGREYVNAD